MLCEPVSIRLAEHSNILAHKLVNRFYKPQPTKPSLFATTNVISHVEQANIIQILLALHKGQHQFLC